MDRTYSEDVSLPGGYRLERDQEFGYFYVVPVPSDESLAEYYGAKYRPPVRLHDPEGRADMVCGLHPKAGRVLDIGCGSGELLAAFRRRGWEVIGVEPRKEDALVARTQGISVIEEVLSEEIAERQGTFHAVLLVHVLEHLPRPKEMVGLVHRLLVPGGIFYCEVPNDFNPLQEAAVKVCGLRQWWIVVPDHLSYFNIDTLSALITGHGFEIVLQTTDFPMEMFLLWGDVYVDNPEVGKLMHLKRCRFEEAMRQAGKGELLHELYVRLAQLGVGREAIVCGRRL